MITQPNPADLPLRDIHLPDPVSWWPMAPGWWLLLFLLVLLISLSVFFLRRRRQYRSSAIYQAKQELDRIHNTFNLTQNKAHLIKELSELLRRVCISMYERKETAALVGEDWLLFLDQYTNNQAFSKGKGRILIDAPYCSEPEYDSAELLQLASNWIDTVSQNRKQIT